MTQNNNLKLAGISINIEPTDRNKFLFLMDNRYGNYISLSLDDTTTLIQWLQGNMGLMLEELMKEREES